MKKMYQKIILLGITLLLLSGCAPIEYQTFQQNPTIADNTSIVLFGVKGKKTVNYLQFMSEKNPPTFNYRSLSVNNDIIALKVDTPQENFSFGVFTAGSAGYLNVGNTITSYGYISADAKAIKIDKKGVYYFGVLDTDTSTINQEIDSVFLDKAKQKYKLLLKDVRPINFRW